jgi:transcriptional regulator with XRE-family HTH domain
VLTQTKFVRLGKGIKLIELAKSAKMSPSLLSKIENGKCRGSKKTRFNIAKALGATEDALFGKEK